MSAPRPEKALFDLLCELFDASELLRFVTLTYGQPLAHDLPEAGSRSSVAFEVAGLLDRRGLVRPELFEALVCAAPAKRGEVTAVAASWGYSLRVQPSAISTPPAVSESTDPPRRIILLCTANAAAQNQRLRLEEELRAIQDALQRSCLREHYEARICPAITFITVLNEMDDQDPFIIHFCGHGDRSGNLILKDELGDETAVPPKRIAELLEALPRRPLLVVFATCHSRALAEAVCPHVEYAIGFEGALDDELVPIFSATLYRRLASRAEIDVPRSFQLAALAARGSGTITAQLFVNALAEQGNS